MKRRDDNTFFCFSPPVMIATFAIEIGLAVYALWRYKLTLVTRLAVLMLVFLATFQLAEYMVCAGNTSNAEWWSRTGYAVITMLPAFGVHLVYAIARVQRKWFIWPTYAVAASFAAYFLLADSAILGQACFGNYVMFRLMRTATSLYVAYYFGLLTITVGLALYYGRRTKQKLIRSALVGLVFAYSVFIVPTIVVNMLSPGATAGIPSIMCGFAVFTALVLVGWVLPSALSKDKRKHV